MIQFAHSPYQGAPLAHAFGQLVKPGLPSQQTSTSPAPVADQGAASPQLPGDPVLDTPWYKRPAILIGGVVGVAALGGLAWWAFRAPKRR